MVENKGDTSSDSSELQSSDEGEREKLLAPLKRQNFYVEQAHIDRLLLERLTHVKLASMHP